MTDEWAIRDAAGALRRLYAELSEALLNPLQPRGERVMRPRPGSQTPAPIYLFSLDEELSSRLHEVVRDAANPIEPGRMFSRDGEELAAWIRFNAAAVSELDFAEDVFLEMTDQARRIERVVAPAAPADLVSRPEPYQLPAVIIQRLASAGRSMSRDALRKHVERSQGTAFAIEKKVRADGEVAYRMSEILAWLDRNKKPVEAAA